MQRDPNQARPAHAAGRAPADRPSGQTPSVEALRRVARTAPVFIYGSQRSGTTLLMRLVRYLRVGFGRDNGYFLRLKRQLPHYGDLGRDDNLRRLVGDIFATPDIKRRFRDLELTPEVLIASLEDRTYPAIVRTFLASWAVQLGCSRWGDKTPDYTLAATDLASMFPDGRFIHVYRDGRDVALSLFQQDWGPKNAFVAGQYWSGRVRAGRALLGDARYLEIAYEALLSDPESQFQQLADFVGFDGDREGAHRRFLADAPTLLRRGNTGKWRRRLAANQIWAFESAAGELLGELGYPIVNPGAVARPISGWRRLLHHVDNLLQKLRRGEGARGRLDALWRLLHAARLGLRYRPARMNRR